MGSKHRESSDRALGNLIRWISRQGDWDGELDSALDDHTALVCEALDTDRETLLEELEPEIVTNVFGCALEDLLSRRYDGPPTNVVDDYLTRRGWRESAPAKRYLQALRDAVVSLYEVVDVKPGHHVDVRDLIRGGDPVRVIERAGSRELVPWDHVAARVLSHLGKHIFSGILLPVSRECAENLREVITASLDEACDESDSGRDTSDSDTLGLRGVAPLITSAWLSDIVGRLTQGLPDFVNFDGERLQPSETHFEIQGSVTDAVVAGLDAVPALERDGTELSWTWLDNDQDREKPTQEGALALGSVTEAGQPTLGGVRIESGRVVLLTNSLERAERGKTMVAAGLGDLVGIGMTRVTSVEHMLAEGAPESEVEDSASDIPADVQARVQQKVLDQHYRAWLDDSIPALDGQSPREAAASDASQPRLVSLLKQLENTEARRSRASGQPPYDCRWMWEALGVDHLRK